MNPYKNLLDRLDVLPEGERRLASGCAWDASINCGCFFGTLFPMTYKGGQFSADFASSVRTTDGSPFAEKFRAWCASLGLTPMMVSHLQWFNDHTANGKNDEWSLTTRYAIVRKELARLADKYQEEAPC